MRLSRELAMGAPMVLTLVPLLMVAALPAPTYPVDDAVTSPARRARRGMIITRPANPPAAIAIRRECGAAMGPPSPACFQLPARGHAVALNRMLAARQPANADHDRWLVEERVAGMAAPGMRALLGLGSSGVALTGRLALTKGSAVRLSVESVVDARPGDGAYYDQAQVGLVNASMPGRHRTY